MKKIKLFLISVLFANCSIGQIMPSNCTANNSGRNISDASRLAVRNLFQANSTYKDTVDIYQPVYTNYLHALMSVYNATFLPARDSVYVLYPVFMTQGPELNVTGFSVDSNIIWAKNLYHHIIPTGYSPLDSLINKYSLQLQSALTLFQPRYYFELKSTTFINTQALSQFIGNFPGCQPLQSAVFLDGSDIIATSGTNYIDLKYSYQWDDCPAICIYERHWLFRAFNDCTIQYMGSGGNSIQGGFPVVISGINENNSELKNATVFPNPVTDKLVLALNDQTNVTTHITLSNLMGQQLIKHEALPLNNKIEINVNDLPAGIYYLQVQNEKGSSSYKVIKE